ncbi:MAG: hypothetical protein DRI90_28000, partial [Deltaproteobacteria bacterium]
MAQVLDAEQRCQGRLCRYGLELAEEWLDKCTKVKPSSVAPTKQLQARYRDAVKSGTSDCAKEVETLLGGGCKADTCAADAQRWATRCGEAEAGPLVLRMVQRTVKRYGGDDAEQLDMRSCDSLRDELRKGASCEDEALCRDLWPLVKLYRKSCEAEDKPPDLVTGIYQMAIAFGADRSDEVVKVSDEPKLIFAGQFPLTLADGKGAILGVCWKRPQESPSYQKLRDECQSGTLDVVRVRSAEGGGRELRFGKVTLPTVLSLTTLYPWVRLVDEQVQEDDRSLAALRGDLAATVGASTAEGVRKLLALVNTHARFLGRSIDAREALGAQDAALTPLFEQLATIKVNGGLRVPSIPNRWSLLQRAKTRPFADFGDDASLQLGAFSAAHSLTLAKTLPKAMAAYRKRLGPLVVMVERGLKPSAADLRVAKQFGRKQVEACDAALDQLVEIEGELLSCPFDANRCGAEQQHALGERWG